MNRETFVTIFSALMAEADDELLREAEGLVFWRKRELRAAQVQRYAAGKDIIYLAKDGQTRLKGTVDHLNKFSLTVRRPHATQGYTNEVVPIERVLGTPVTAHTVPFNADLVERSVIGRLLSEGREDLGRQDDEDTPHG